MAIASLIMTALLLADGTDSAGLFEQAVQEQQTAGNVEKAVKLFEKIVETDPKSALAPKALIHIAQCDEQLKKSEDASHCYMRVVTQYPNAKEAKQAIPLLAPMGKETSLPPLVLTTSPIPFANDVPATLGKVSVTFSRPMMDKSWSWTGSDVPSVGAPRYDKLKMTCSLPVKLEPGKVYWVGINSPSYRNFQTREQLSVPWYIILFATARSDGSPTAIPDELLEKARKINAAHDEILPFLRQIDESASSAAAR